MRLYADQIQREEEERGDMVDEWAELHDGGWPRPEICKFAEQGCESTCKIAVECGRERREP